MKEMIKQIREREGGFTIAELLIVVAIIAVLVAIAIPVFSAQLAKAEVATDEANCRALYGDAQAEWLAHIGDTTTYTLTATASGTTLTFSDGQTVTLNRGSATCTPSTDGVYVTYTVSDDDAKYTHTGTKTVSWGKASS